MGINGILVFDTELNPTVEYTGPALDPFVGPKRFLGALGMPGIYLIDEKTWITDRLIYMLDVTGAGWTTYGSPGQFIFFEDMPS